MSVLGKNKECPSQNKYWQVKHNIQFSQLLPNKRSAHINTHKLKRQIIKSVPVLSFWRFLSDKYVQRCPRALEISQTSMENLRDFFKKLLFSHFHTHACVSPLSLLPQQNGDSSRQSIFIALWGYDGTDWAAASLSTHPLCGLSILREETEKWAVAVRACLLALEGWYCIDLTQHDFP